jgi:hypothetical protein
MLPLSAPLLLQESPVVSPLLSHESSPLSPLLSHEASPLLSSPPLLAQVSAQALHTSTAVGPAGSEGCGVSVGGGMKPASA